MVVVAVEEKVRHVRDVAYWNLPYGTPIIGRAKTPLTHLQVTDGEYAGVDRVLGSDGSSYEVGYDEEDGAWFAITTADLWDDYAVRWAKTEEEAYILLNQQVERKRKRKGPALFGSLSDLDDEQQQADLIADLKVRHDALKKVYGDKRKATYDRTIAGLLQNYRDEKDPEIAQEFIDKAEEQVAGYARQAELRARADQDLQRRREERAARRAKVSVVASAGSQVGAGDSVRVQAGKHQGAEGTVVKVLRTNAVVKVKGKNVTVPLKDLSKIENPHLNQQEKLRQRELNKRLKDNEARIKNIERFIDPAKDTEKTGLQVGIDAYRRHVASTEHLPVSQRLRELSTAEQYLANSEKVVEYRKQRASHGTIGVHTQKIGKHPVRVVSMHKDKTGTEVIAKTEDNTEYTIWTPALNLGREREGWVRNESTGVRTSFMLPPARGLSVQQQIDAMQTATEKAFDTAVQNQRKLNTERKNPVVKRSEYRKYQATVGTLLKTDQQKATLERLIAAMEKANVGQARKNLQALKNQVAKDGARPGIVGKMRAVQHDIDSLVEGDARTGKAPLDKNLPPKIVELADAFNIDATFEASDDRETYTFADLKDPSVAAGRCGDADSAFAMWADEQGVTADSLSTGGPFGLGNHYASVVRVDGQDYVFDYAFRQFDPESPWPVVLPLPEYRRLLEKNGIDPDSVDVERATAEDRPDPVVTPHIKTIRKDNLSNPNTPRTRAVSQEEFNALATAGMGILSDYRDRSSEPILKKRDHAKRITADAWGATRQEWGGMTIDAHTGDVVEDGMDAYAMSVKDPETSSVSVPITASKAQFEAAYQVAVHRFADELSSENAYLGIFRDEDTGRIDFDPVLVVHTLDEVEAIGAYTNAVGGAYYFMDGNGYWPPYVAD